MILYQIEKAMSIIILRRKTTITKELFCQTHACAPMSL